MIHILFYFKWSNLVIRVGPFLLAASLLMFSSYAQGSPKEVDFKVSKKMKKLLYANCYSCHDEYEQEGDVRLDQLDKMSLEVRLDLMNKMQEKISFEEMPPRDETEQPTAEERAGMLKWLSAELKKYNASKLEDKLRMPQYGNYVDHEKLFSGDYAGLKGYTRDRRWLISEYIFNSKFNRILRHQPRRKIDGVSRLVIGENKRRVSLTNPFLLPTNSGVRYYANSTLNGGHLLTMLTNAKNAAIHMTGVLAKRDRGYLPSVNKIMAMEDRHAAVLSSRNKFLSLFIERVLVDLYGKKHAGLLPRFESSVEKKQVVSAKGKVKKAGFHSAKLGPSEMVLIFRTMRRHEEVSKSDADLIRRCEREWFNFGHNARNITARVRLLQNYMKEWRSDIKTHRLDAKHRVHVYRPLAESEMEVVRKTILKCRKKGDSYLDIIDKCNVIWKAEFGAELSRAGLLDVRLLKQLVSEAFFKVHERVPTGKESEQYVSLMQKYITNLGKLGAIQKLLETLILRSDFVYRQEHGVGEADEHGRRMMSAFDASYALAYAITDSSPDVELLKAVREGKLSTRDDYRREVVRMLKKRDQFYIIDESVERLRRGNITNLPIRKLRFFREFFGYQKLLPIFKDNKRFGGNYDNAKGHLVSEADMLVDHILRKDKNVIERLLDTEDFYVFHSGDNEAMKKASLRIKEIYEYFKDKGWEEFEAGDLFKHKDFLIKANMRVLDAKGLDGKGGKGEVRSLRSFKAAMKSFTMRLEKGQKAPAPYDSFPAHGPSNAATRTGDRIGSIEVAKFFNVALDKWDYPMEQPAKMPYRKGMLTHPAWLIAYSQNTETDPIHRGKWIREKLLAGTIPDIPITVEAVIPEDHHNTLRTRLAKLTEKKACWRCHERMNPLGYAFEMYDDFGRMRKKESLEHPENLIKKGLLKAAPHVDLRDTYKTLAVDSRGSLSGTGDKKLDGKVRDAIDLADRLSRSSRVRQSVIRHAFRYFMGRNELLSDSKTLIDADRAYVESGGSFDAVIVSLLSSDSFIYRKAD